MKPSANLDAAVISKVTRNARIAILGNILPISDPVRMAEELAMLDCYSGGRLISGCVRGGAVETLQAGLDPTENRARFEEAHDLILKCWTTPGPFRWEGRYYPRRVVNPWVLPMQQPHPPIWFPGGSSPESVVWAARHRYTYIKPTVSRGVTYAVVCTYGCDGGRISPTRCAVIDAGLDGRYRLHRSYKTPPAVAGSAHVGLAAASRLASTADPDGFPRSRTTPPSAITPCGDATPA